jgi:hypothetical protein
LACGKAYQTGVLNCFLLRIRELGAVYRKRDCNGNTLQQQHGELLLQRLKWKARHCGAGFAQKIKLLPAYRIEIPA